MEVLVKANLEPVSPVDEEFDKIMIGQRLKAAREGNGLSQYQWSALIGKSQQSISNWECGRVLPQSVDLFKYAFMLGTDLHWLVTGKPYNRRSKQQNPLQAL